MDTSHTLPPFNPAMPLLSEEEIRVACNLVAFAAAEIRLLSAISKWQREKNSTAFFEELEQSRRVLVYDLGSTFATLSIVYPDLVNDAVASIHLTRIPNFLTVVFLQDLTPEQMF